MRIWYKISILIVFKQLAAIRLKENAAKAAIARKMRAKGIGSHRVGRARKSQFQWKKAARSHAVSRKKQTARTRIRREIDARLARAASGGASATDGGMGMVFTWLSDACICSKFSRVMLAQVLGFLILPSYCHAVRWLV